jgi:hypothetical protein
MVIFEYSYLNDTNKFRSNDMSSIVCSYEKLIIVLNITILYILILLFILCAIEQHYTLVEKNHLLLDCMQDQPESQSDTEPEQENMTKMSSVCRVCNRSFDEGLIPCDITVCHNPNSEESVTTEEDESIESGECMIDKKRR